MTKGTFQVTVRYTPDVHMRLVDVSVALRVLADNLGHGSPKLGRVYELLKYGTPEWDDQKRDPAKSLYLVRRMHTFFKEHGLEKAWVSQEDDFPVRGTGEVELEMEFLDTPTNNPTFDEVFAAEAARPDLRRPDVAEAFAFMDAHGEQFRDLSPVFLAGRELRQFIHFNGTSWGVYDPFKHHFYHYAVIVMVRKKAA